MTIGSVLDVEDSKDLAEGVGDFLKADGFEVCLAFDGHEALRLFDSFKPQLVILDILLPQLDGMEVCRLIRSSSPVPIIILSAKTSEADKILGLGLGADDYVTKPFSPAELVARVKAHLRRDVRLSAPAGREQPISTGDVEIDCRLHEVHVSGKPVTLTAREFDLLSFLVRNPRQVFSRDQLFEHVWGTERFGDIGAVAVYIRRIREKIEPNPSKPRYILTVRGVGYRFEDANA